MVAHGGGHASLRGHDAQRDADDRPAPLDIRRVAVDRVRHGSGCHLYRLRDVGFTVGVGRVDPGASMRTGQLKGQAWVWRDNRLCHDRCSMVSDHDIGAVFGPGHRERFKQTARHTAQKPVLKHDNSKPISSKRASVEMLLQPVELLFQPIDPHSGVDLIFFIQQITLVEEE